MIKQISIFAISLAVIITNQQTLTHTMPAIRSMPANDTRPIKRRKTIHTADLPSVVLPVLYTRPTIRTVRTRPTKHRKTGNTAHCPDVNLPVLYTRLTYCDDDAKSVIYSDVSDDTDNE